MTRWVFVLCLSLAGLVGCGIPPEPLPAVAWDDLAEAKRVLIANRDAIDTVQAEADIFITGADGKRQTFDGAIVMHQPDRYRMRAWKLTQTLFDLTVNDDGIWVAASDELRKRRPDAEKELGQLAERLGLLLRGPDYADARFTRRRGELTARWPQGSATIDPVTLSPRTFRFANPERDERFEVRTQFADYDGLRWYDHVEIEGAFGTVRLEFRNVEVNRELNPRAFKPPRRAVQP
jgi:hypothetical protein